jgi:putative oxidoreductase
MLPALWDRTLMSFRRLSADHALVPLRLIMGVGFLVHGLAKWNRGPAKFGVLLERLGLPMPAALAWAGTLTEILGGIALLIGVAVLLVWIPLAIMMLVAMFTIHIHYGFSAVNTIGLTATGPILGPPGYEINLLYLAGLFALGLSGPTSLSVDAWWTRRRQREAS